jgi:hypothetical protein
MIEQLFMRIAISYKLSLTMTSQTQRTQYSVSAITTKGAAATRVTIGATIIQKKE